VFPARELVTACQREALAGLWRRERLTCGFTSREQPADLSARCSPRAPSLQVTRRRFRVECRVGIGGQFVDRCSPDCVRHTVVSAA
jgi:hypothetical protein